MEVALLSETYAYSYHMSWRHNFSLPSPCAVSAGLLLHMYRKGILMFGSSCSPQDTGHSLPRSPRHPVSPKRRNLSTEVYTVICIVCSLRTAYALGFVVLLLCLPDILLHQDSNCPVGPYRLVTGHWAYIIIFRNYMWSLTKKKKKKLHGLSPRANYTDRLTAASRRSNCQLLRIKGATWSAWRVPTAVFSIF
jgi:hypothetical protein